MTEMYKQAVERWLGNDALSHCTQIQTEPVTITGSTTYTWSPLQGEVKATALYRHLRRQLRGSAADIDVSTVPLSDIAGANELRVKISPKPMDSSIRDNWQLVCALLFLGACLLYFVMTVASRKR
jgi:hypothetical protein